MNGERRTYLCGLDSLHDLWRRQIHLYPRGYAGKMLLLRQLYNSGNCFTPIIGHCTFLFGDFEGLLRSTETAVNRQYTSSHIGAKAWPDQSAILLYLE
jgi:hypothetical protein